MRELKFRAWDGAQMLTEENFDFVVSDCDSIIRLDEYGWTEHGVDCVEQYTGLKDKNGKEIYEGDIVQMPDWVEHPKHEIVRFTKLACGFEPFVCGCMECWSPDGEEVEVIGNVHENPKLLGEEEE